MTRKDSEASLNGSSPSPLPDIVIPSEWYKWWLDSTKKPSSPVQVRHRCDACAWDGQDTELFQHSEFIAQNLQDLDYKDCVSCQSLKLAADSITKRLGYKKRSSLLSEADLIHWGSSFDTPPNPRIAVQRPFHFNTGHGVVGVYLFTPNDENKRPNPCGIPMKKILKPDALSSRTISWAKNALANCFENHEECCHKSPGKAFLPTRLIAIKPLDSGDDVKLVDTENMARDTRYAALSYVWGEANLQEKSKTTRDNVKEYGDRIPWTVIPKTLQDAISFTRKLGLDYIWIDSLCIIQNDVQEWNHEAGRMFEVYKNSFVMLGALWSTDCSSGLFNNPDTLHSEPIATLRLGEESWPLHVSREHEILELNYHWNGTRPRLLTRGWCFQERLIPSRCIFFGRNELIFGCYSKVTCECGIQYREDPVQEVEVVEKEEEEEGGKVCGEEVDTVQPDRANKTLNESNVSDHGLRWLSKNAHHAWRDVVDEYTKLDVTESKERLIALGAVADQLHYARPGEEYLAGLWSGSFITDMLWYIPSGNWYHGSDDETIPTWSWAHRGKKVTYKHAECVTPTAQVIKAECLYHDGNSFGMLLESKLVLRGRLMPWWSFTSCVINKACNIVATFFNHHHLYGRGGTRVHVSRAYEDTHFWDSLPRHAFLFEMGRIGDEGDAPVYLVLQRRDKDSQTYARVGIVHPRFREDGEDNIPQDLQALNAVFSKRAKEATINLV